MMKNTVKSGGIDGFDFRHVDLNTMSDDGIFTAQRKRDAALFAKQHGWLVQDVTAAYNRFMRFWIVGQQQADEYVVLTKRGNVRRLGVDLK